MIDQVVRADLLAICQGYDHGVLLPNSNFDEFLPLSLATDVVCPPMFQLNQLVFTLEHGLGFVKAYSYRTGGVYCSFVERVVVEVVGHWAYAIAGAGYPFYHWYEENAVSLEG